MKKLKSIGTHHHLMFFFLALGIFLRFYRLDFHSLWIDEIITYFETRVRSYPEMMASFRAKIQHPPLYWILERIFAPITGNSESGLRFLAALFGSLCLPAVYLTGRWVFSKHVGLHALILFSVAFVPIYMSQEARSYSMLMLLIAPAVLLWFKIFLQNQNSLVWLLSYGLLGGVMAWTHYMGAIFLFAQGLSSLVILPWNKKWIQKWLTAYGTALLLFSPWMPILLKAGQSDSHWMKSFDWAWALTFPREIFGNSPVLAALSLGLIFFHFYRRRIRQAPFPKMEAFLLAWVLITLLIGYLVSVVTAPMLHWRYFSYAAVPLILVLAASLESIEKIKYRRWTLALLVGLSLAGLIFSKKHYSVPKKRRIRETLTQAKKWFNENPSLLATNQDFLPDYYILKINGTPPQPLILHKESALTALTQGMKESNTKEVVFYGWRKVDPNLISVLESNFQVLEKYQGSKGVVALRLRPKTL